jgi:hypothetical protein
MPDNRRDSALSGQEIARHIAPGFFSWKPGLAISTSVTQGHEKNLILLCAFV